METPRDPGNLQRPGQEDLGADPGVQRGPQAPAPEAPQATPSGPGYGGPVPPGGWQQPLPQAGLIPRDQLAGWWPRAGAYLIDSLIVGLPAAIVLGALIGLGAAVGDSTGGAVAVVLTFLLALLVVTAVALLYAPLLMRRPGERNGQTWGKQAVGIRVVRTTGLPFDFGTGALREIVLKQLAVGLASSFFFGLPALLNFLWPLWDDDNRALHDMAAQTRVVRA
jgi:uncharacterized RDD family membrane protein YckC